MNILITGGQGYLGGRIASYLQGLDSFYVKVGSRKKRTSPEWLLAGEVVSMDLESDASLDKACENADVIVHLAALNHTDCARNPEEALKVNTLGTLKLIRAAERSGVKKFIYFSTAHIYGAPLQGCISEETIPRPVHAYSLTHKAAEDYVLAASDSGSMAGVVLRLSNAFGYPMGITANCWSLLVNDLCRQAVVSRSLTLNSTGKQRRDFITLTDVQRAVAHMINISPSKLGNGVFNIGGAWPSRILDMAELIQKRCFQTLGYSPEIICPKSTAAEPEYNLEYSINKLLSTGFNLKSPIDEEIDQLLLLCKRVDCGQENE